MESMAKTKQTSQKGSDIWTLFRDDPDQGHARMAERNKAADKKRKNAEKTEKVRKTEITATAGGGVEKKRYSSSNPTRADKSALTKAKKEYTKMDNQRKKEEKTKRIENEKKRNAELLEAKRAADKALRDAKKSSSSSHTSSRQTASTSKKDIDVNDPQQVADAEEAMGPGFGVYTADDDFDLPYLRAVFRRVYTLVLFDTKIVPDLLTENDNNAFFKKAMHRMCERSDHHIDKGITLKCVMRVLVGGGEKFNDKVDEKNPQPVEKYYGPTSDKMQDIINFMTSGQDTTLMRVVREHLCVNKFVAYAVYMIAKEQCDLGDGDVVCTWKYGWHLLSSIITFAANLISYCAVCYEGPYDPLGLVNFRTRDELFIDFEEKVAGKWEQMKKEIKGTFGRFSELHLQTAKTRQDPKMLNLKTQDHKLEYICTEPVLVSYNN